MGNSNSTSNSKTNEASYSTCTGRGASGLNEYCYNTGYDHGRGTSLHNPDPIGEGISALPCRTNDNANQCYTKGYTDGMSGRSIGVSAGDNYREIRTRINDHSKNKQNTQNTTENLKIKYDSKIPYVQAPSGYFSVMEFDLNHWHDITETSSRVHPMNVNGTYFYCMGIYNSLPYWINQHNIYIWGDTHGVFQIGTAIGKNDLECEKHNGLKDDRNYLIGWNCKKCGELFNARRIFEKTPCRTKHG